MLNLGDNHKGALLMMGSMAAFTVNDAFMKSLAPDVPIFQAIFLRGVATVVVLVVLGLALGGIKLHLGRRNWRLILLRAAVEALSAYLFIEALFHMPIANLSAILQALPLTVTLAGAVFLGEAVGWRRLAAIILGLIGVLLIVRPGSEGFNIFSIYGVLAVLAVTARDLFARRLSPEVPSMTVALVAAVVVTLLAGAGSLTETWAPVTDGVLLRLAGAVMFIIGGYLFSVSAMRVGEIAIVAPFRYTSLLCAIALGVLVFGERPDALTLTGAAVVVATGAFTLYRERRLRRPAGPMPLRVR